MIESPSIANPPAAESTVDAAHWQAVVDDSEALFAELCDGARMGLVAHPGFAPPGRRRAGFDAAVAKHAGVPMLAFDALNGRIEVTVERFESYDRARLDLLFVADEEARAELAATPPADTLGVLKRLVRRGDVMFFVFRTRSELQDAGYEDFLDSLGLAFLGACR
jgi:hypothetical protein